MSLLDEFPLSTSAYLADTQHLTLPQHGAYLLILMTMWRAKGWLPDDDRILASICKLSVTKWRQIAPAVRALLLVRNGQLSQKRLLSESEKALAFVSKNRANGKLGGIAKSLKTKNPSLANATISPPRSLDSGQSSEKTLSSSSLLSRDSEIQRKKERKSAGSLLSSDWQPTASDFEYGRRLGFGDREVGALAEDMRMWAVANANRAVARKADWTATFHGWMCRKAGERKPDRPRSRDGFAALARRFNEEDDDDGQYATRPADDAQLVLGALPDPRRSGG